MSFHSLKIVIFNYPFLNTVPFQDGRYSILSLVCLALLCSVFKVRSRVLCPVLCTKPFPGLSGSNPEFKQKTIAFCLKSKFNSLTRIFGNFSRFSCYLLMCFLLLTRSGVQRCMSLNILPMWLFFAFNKAVSALLVYFCFLTRSRAKHCMFIHASDSDKVKNKNGGLKCLNILPMWLICLRHLSIFCLRKKWWA